MTFQQFIDAVKSTWGAANNFTVIVALFTALGINAVLPSVPGSGAVIACLLFYLIGFLASCINGAQNPTHGEIDALRHQLATKDVQIASLEAELAGRPTQEELDERDVTISSLERDLGARNHADAERAELRETFLHKIDFDHQAAVVGAWLSPGRRLDVSARPVRGLGGGFSLDELLVPDGDGWARATDGAVSLLDSSGDLVALVMGRKIEDAAGPAHSDLSRALREMDFHTKCTLVAVWEHGSADVTWIDPDDPDAYDDMFSEIDETFLRMTNARLRDLELFGLVRYETVSGWDRRWTLEDGVADLLAENSDALASAREDAALTWERLTEIPGQGCPPSDEPSSAEDGTVPGSLEVTEAT